MNKKNNIKNNNLIFIDKICKNLNIKNGDYIELNFIDNELHLKKVTDKINQKEFSKNSNILQLNNFFESRSEIVQHIENLKSIINDSEDYLVNYQKMLSLEHPLHILTGRDYWSYNVENNELKFGKLTNNSFSNKEGYSELRHFDKSIGFELPNIFNKIKEVSIDFNSLKNYNKDKSYLILVRYGDNLESSTSVLDYFIKEYVIISLS